MLANLRPCALALLWIPLTFSLPRAESQTSPPDERAAKVDRLFARWDARDTPGCALAVIHEGKLLHKRGYGMANLEHQVPITPLTVFNIASVSKQFTVFLILLLVTAGQMSLDDDVRKHLPELPDFGKTITVRHLIHHTSGLREDWSLLHLAGYRSEDVITLDDVRRLILRQRELNFEPGAEYLYCNTGYDLLGDLVRRVGGKSVREQARAKIFEPLGMKDSVIQDDFRMLIPGRSASYAPRPGGGFGHVLLASERAGPSNLFTTVEDLAKWDQNFYEPRSGTRAVLDLMHVRGKLNDGREIPYAGGLIHGSYRGLKIVEHTGSSAAYRSILLRFPEERFSVIILANVSAINTRQMARQVADVYLEGRLQPGKGSDAPPKEPKLPAAIGTPAPASAWGEYAGEFHSQELGVTYRATLAEGKLLLRHPRGESALRPTGKDQFAGEVNGPVAVRFTRGEDDRVTGLTASTPRARNLRFHKGDFQAGPEPPAVKYASGVADAFLDALTGNEQGLTNAYRLLTREAQEQVGKERTDKLQYFHDGGLALNPWKAWRKEGVQAGPNQREVLYQGTLERGEGKQAERRRFRLRLVPEKESGLWRVDFFILGR